MNLRRVLLGTLLRTVVLAAVVTAYMLLVVPLMGEPGDANIGAGLIAFGLLVVASFGWALHDASRSSFLPTAVCWALVGLLTSLGWVVLLMAQEADELGTREELVSAGLALVPFTAALIIVPALVGAALGSTTGPGRGPGAP